MKAPLLLLLPIAISISSNDGGAQQIVSRGPHHRDIQWEGSDRGYTEIAVGMHFWNGANYQEARKVLEPAPGGAAARFGQVISLASSECLQPRTQ